MGFIEIVISVNSLSFMFSVKLPNVDFNCVIGDNDYS